jgi:hypothetical protein
MAAHLFETGSATPYMVTLTGYDAIGSFATKVQAITITPASTQWPAAATVCINPIGDSNFAGCPGATFFNTNSMATALGNISGTVKRILFKRGGNFSTAGDFEITTAGPGLVGAYGSGAKPIINGDITVSGTDWRVDNLNFGAHIALPFAGDFITISNCTFDGGGPSEGSAIAFPSTGSPFGNMAAVGNTITNQNSGAVIYGSPSPSKWVVLLGNDIRDGNPSGHLVRIESGAQNVSADNLIAGPSGLAGGSQLRHGDEQANTYLVVTRNIIEGKLEAGVNAGDNHQLIDSNIISYIVAQSPNQGMILLARNTTIRNNLFSFVNNFTGDDAKAVDLIGGSNAWIYNNSFWYLPNNLSLVVDNSGATNVFADNNALWATNGPTDVYRGAITITSVNNSSTDAQSAGPTNPYTSATPANAAGFYPSGAAAHNLVNTGAAVPVWKDFSDNPRASTFSIGAVQP